jgi:RNA polymerase sigma-70 factor (ECF subfamily)
MGSKKWDINCVLEQLRQGDDELFKTLYQTYKGDFAHWLRNAYQVSEETALDCFQEAMSNLYLNAYTGQIRVSNASLKTYLFAIGRNQLFKINHQYDKEFQLNFPEEEDDEAFIEWMYDPEREKTIEGEKVRHLLDSIEKPCRKVLQLVYLSSNTYEQTAKLLGYSTQGLRTKKWRCLKKLRAQLDNK